MSMPGWRPIGLVDTDRLKEARLQAHHAVQWLARAARAFIPPRPDDSHTNLGWDEPRGAFVTHPYGDGSRVALRVGDLTLTILGDARAGDSQPLALAGHTDAQARAWIGEQFRVRGFDPAALDAPAPYEIPAHPVASGALYGGTGLMEALGELAAWFTNANLALRRVQRSMIERKLAASAVRCWPHHFDLATLISLDSTTAENVRSVNAGLSPGDEYYEEPYYYVSPYPEPDAAARATLPKSARLHTHEFVAAINTSRDITHAKNPYRATETFLDESVNWALAALGHA